MNDLSTHASCLRKAIPFPLADQQGYDATVELLNRLLDESGGDEEHQLAPLIDLVGTIIEAFEHDRADVPGATPAETLRFLLQQHDLRQSDLPEIGSQGVVSEILSGKRELNPRQVRALAERFGVSPGTFL